MIVVDAGGSGLCCAAEATSHGANVLLVEIASNIDGSTFAASHAAGAHAAITSFVAPLREIAHTIGLASSPMQISHALTRLRGQITLDQRMR